MYNPPRCSDFIFIQDVLESQSPLYDNIVITGNFNVNQLVQSSVKTALTNVLKGFGAYIINSNPTHCMSASHNPSCIDLLNTNNPTKVLMSD